MTEINFEEYDPYTSPIAANIVSVEHVDILSSFLSHDFLKDLGPKVQETTRQTVGQVHAVVT